MGAMGAQAGHFLAGLPHVQNPFGLYEEGHHNLGCGIRIVSLSCIPSVAR